MKSDKPLLEAIPGFPLPALAQCVPNTRCRSGSLINNVMQCLNDCLSGDPSPGVNVIVDVALHFLLVERQDVAAKTGEWARSAGSSTTHFVKLKYRRASLNMFIFFSDARSASRRRTLNLRKGLHEGGMAREVSFAPYKCRVSVPVTVQVPHVVQELFGVRPHEVVVVGTVTDHFSLYELQS